MIYLELFWTFFTIGALTFGGGYAMLPLIQSEVAARWGHVISGQNMVDFVAVSEATPGPFAVNMATYVGAEMGGLFGSFCATLGVVLPSFVVILIVAKCYERFQKSKLVKGCMSGLKPAVVGLIGNAVVNVLSTVFFSAGWSLAVLSAPIFYIYAGMLVLMIVLTFRKIHPIIIICLSAVIGIVLGYLGF